MRSEECVCGGLITAPSLNESQPYVEAHVLLPGHQAWRAVQEGWFSREGPTVPQQVVDLSERVTDASASPASISRDGAA